MTTTQPVATTPAPAPMPPPTARQHAASSRLLLWVPVPLWIAIAFLAIHGESSSYQPSTDEFGLAPIALGLLCTLLGLVSLVIALAFSFGGASFRAKGVLVSSTWFAVTGVLFSGFGVVAIATGGSGAGEFVVAGVVSLLPLGLALAVRPRDERP